MNLSLILAGSRVIIPMGEVAHVYMWEWGLWLVPLSRVFPTDLTRISLLNLLNDLITLPHSVFQG